MRRKYMLLANAADLSRDGNFSILGADFNQINASGFPAVHPQIAVVAKLFARPEESGTPQVVRFRIIAPGGAQIGTSDATATPVRNQLDPEGESEVGFVTIFQLVSIPGPGRYVVEMASAGERLDEAAFYAVLNPPPESAP